MTDRIDMSNHAEDRPVIEVVDPEAERKELLGDYEPEEFKKELGVDPKAMISPKKPEPELHKGTCMAVLTHKGVFSPPECTQIIKDNDNDWRASAVQEHGSSDIPFIKDDIRTSSQTWVEQVKENLWLFDKMLALTMAANKEFQFDIDFFEALQLARYETGQFYTKHIDMGAGHMGNRKLGISVQLSDPDTYEGGDIVCDNNGHDFIAPRELGSVTVFPSFMPHQVTPVTKGTRYSLVVWASGKQRFR